jgi:DNA-binding transcriptional LysR family regulator
VLDAVERLLDGVGALQVQPAGRLRVAASYTIAEHLLPDWLAALRLRHPDAGVQLEVVNSTGVLARVHEGAVDLGFIESPGRPAGVSVEVVGHDELAVVCAPGHPWATRHRPLPAADLAATPLVLREAGSGTREAFARAMAAAGLTVAQPALELGSTASVLHAVAQGAAPTVISPLAIARERASGELVVVPVEGLDLHRPLAAVWRPGATRGPLADALIAIARRA